MFVKTCALLTIIWQQLNTNYFRLVFNFPQRLGSLSLLRKVILEPDEIQQFTSKTHPATRRF